jgi:small-conductance mechanosensitive channel
VTRLELRLTEALSAGTAGVRESPDLFERVVASIDEDRDRRRWRRTWAWRIATGTGVLAAVAVGLGYRTGRFEMDWWILEVVTAVVLVTLVLLLGPFIKRFGRSYAADVFRSNPGTGKSFIVLTDFAYYLIFSAYVLFVVQFARPREWSVTVGAEQVGASVVRVGGMLLVMGVLHGLNLVLLPIIGRLLTLNKRLDQQMRERDPVDDDPLT